MVGFIFGSFVVWFFCFFLPSRNKLEDWLKKITSGR